MGWDQDRETQGNTVGSQERVIRQRGCWELTSVSVLKCPRVRGPEGRDWILEPLAVVFPYKARAQCNRYHHSHLTIPPTCRRGSHHRAFAHAVPAVHISPWLAPLLSQLLLLALYEEASLSSLMSPSIPTCLHTRAHSGPVVYFVSTAISGPRSVHQPEAESEQSALIPRHKRHSSPLNLNSSQR